jgi:predicted kinase
MRILVLTRGAMGSGKSTFIKENFLEQYTLSADTIRLLCQSPILKPDGGLGISQNNDRKVWTLLFEMLEERMIRGEFTVIDATNTKTSEMNKYKALAEKYRFKIICVDFTDVTMELALYRNKCREGYKFVPEDAIKNAYSRFATQNVPSGIQVIKPEQFENTIQLKPINLSAYTKIHHIGDIHGCYTVLNDYLQGNLHSDEMYIFLGDFIDRGIENAEVIKFMCSIMDEPNVIMLEGNHERWLWCWANDIPSKSPEFEHNTKKELMDKGINKKQVRMFYRKLRQLAYYTYNEKIVLVTHGGLSTIPSNLTYIATEQLIKGTGDYKDMEVTNESFLHNTTENCYQIHGHRNVSGSDIQINERCYNLEGKIEFGGYLRVVTLDVNGFVTIEKKNTIFNPSVHQVQETRANITKQVMSNNDFLQMLRRNKNIKEKQFGNISSFNFTREVFYDKIWNEQTIKARGLFLNTSTGEIVIRSYNKFFNIDERPETKLDKLQTTLNFPVDAYIKENGYLGLVGYDSESDQLVIASKSSLTGDFKEWFQHIFFNTVSAEDRETLKFFLKENNCCFVFEVIDPENDPHMIEYENAHLVLLDVIYREVEFRKMPFTDLATIAMQFGLKYKLISKTIKDWADFYKWYNDNEQGWDETLEGYVIEDKNGFMTKVKLPFYHFWKRMRTLKDEVGKKGYIKNTSSLTTPLANEFYGWARDKFKETPELLNSGIIALRKMFYNFK